MCVCVFFFPVVLFLFFSLPPPLFFKSLNGRTTTCYYLLIFSLFFRGGFWDGRLESVIRGREKFERNTHAGGLTNLEKQRKKNYLMVRKGAAVKNKTKLGAKQVKSDSGGGNFVALCSGDISF